MFIPSPRTPENLNNRFFWVDERIFPTVVAWRTSAPKDEMSSADTYSALDVVTLNIRRTPIQKQPELLLCLVGLSRSYFLGDDVYPIFLDDDDRGGCYIYSAFTSLIVKTGTRPRAAHEVPLLTATATRVIDMKDVTEASESSGIPSPVEKSHLDFVNEDPLPVISERVGTGGQARDEVLHEIPPVGNPSTTSSEIPTGNVATAEVQNLQSAESSESGKSTSVPSTVGSPKGIYQPGWGVTNSCRLDTPDAFQDVNSLVSFEVLVFSAKPDEGKHYNIKAYTNKDDPPEEVWREEWHQCYGERYKNDKKEGPVDGISVEVLFLIETEKLLAELVEAEMNKRQKEGSYMGKKFNAICHFFGYQARGSLPLKFDCDYAYVLGHITAMMSVKHNGHGSRAMTVGKPFVHPATDGKPFVHPAFVLIYVLM
ncbi:gypsy type transposase, partial [Tanacetum coccineum]